MGYKLAVDMESVRVHRGGYTSAITIEGGAKAK